MFLSHSNVAYLCTIHLVTALQFFTYHFTTCRGFDWSTYPQLAAPCATETSIRAFPSSLFSPSTKLRLLLNIIPGDYMPRLSREMSRQLSNVGVKILEATELSLSRQTRDNRVMRVPVVNFGSCRAWYVVDLWGTELFGMGWKSRARSMM